MAENASGPEFIKYFPAIVDALKARGGHASARDVVDEVFERAGVSQEERRVTLASGESRQKNQMRWARFYLLRAGLMGAAVRGEWRLTAAGLKATLDTPGAVLEFYREVHGQLRDGANGAHLDATTELTEADVSAGVGVEDEDDEEASVERPYDTTRTQIVTKPLTIEQLQKRLKYGEIDLQPDFQRRAHLWTDERKGRLIESILLRIPLPMFYFDASNDDRWLVVDGLQRLSTLQHFMVEQDPDKRLTLRGLEYLRQFNGKTFEQLPRDMQRRIEEAQVFAHLIMPGTPPEFRFHIFKRINTGGLVLSSQEIRHALYGHGVGRATTWLRELAESDEFLAATGGAVSPERMLDMEFVLRFAAFSITPYGSYQDKGMDDFLNRHMEILNASSEKTLQQLGEQFRRAMTTAVEIFGPHTFRKNTADGQSRSPINKALFEVWSVTLGRCSLEACARLIERRAAVVAAARRALKDDSSFETAITQGTNDTRKVHLRFETVEGIVRNVQAAP
jgi:Protein of unknown function DUF262/Mrr N-terminal domain